MERSSKHILLCGSFRISGDPQGICAKKGAHSLLGYLQGELVDRGMDEVTLSATSCLNVCDRGPVIVIHPDDVWYGGIDSEEKVDQILDALEEGQADGAAELIIHRALS